RSTERGNCRTGNRVELARSTVDSARCSARAAGAITCSPASTSWHSGTVHWVAGIGKEFLVQAPQNQSTLQRPAAAVAVRRRNRAALSGPGLFEPTLDAESTADRAATAELRRCDQPESARAPRLGQTCQGFRIRS